MVFIYKLYIIVIEYFEFLGFYLDILDLCIFYALFMSQFCMFIFLNKINLYLSDLKISIFNKRHLDKYLTSRFYVISHLYIKVTCNNSIVGKYVSGDKKNY